MRELGEWLLDIDENFKKNYSDKKWLPGLNFKTFADMETLNPVQPTSAMTPELQGAPTIGAKPLNPQSVVSPIRRRFRSSQAVWYVLGVVEILLLLRFFLKLIGASESAGFTRFIYIVSFPFAGAFMGVVNPATFDKSVFDWSILLAMVIYGVVAWGAIKLLVMSKPISDQEARTKLDRQE